MKILKGMKKLLRVLADPVLDTRIPALREVADTKCLHLDVRLAAAQTLFIEGKGK